MNEVPSYDDLACHQARHEDGGWYCAAHGRSWPCAAPSEHLAVVPVVRFDGGKPPHQVHFPTRPGWRWGWCDCPIGETHNENARP